MITDKKLKAFLMKHNITYTYHPHKPIFTVDEAKDIKNNIPGLHTKNLFLKENKSGHFFLVSMNGFKRLDIKELQKKLEVKKLSFGSPEELYTELKVKPGHCSIFCMIHAKTCQLIIDKEVWDAKEFGFHPNKNNATLVINHLNLKKYLRSIKFDKKYIFEL